MAFYAIVVYLHIVAALGLFAALGLEWAGLRNLRRATTTGQARTWTGLLGAVRRVAGPAMLAILATGIYLMAAQWGGQGWIGAGVAGLVLLGALGGGLSGRRLGALARDLPAEEGGLPTPLRARLRDPALLVSLWVRTALALGVVFVMSTKPAAAQAVTALGVALVLGITAGLATVGRQRRPLVERTPETS
jgi:hypothetical protein